MSKLSKETEAFRKFVYDFCIDKFKTLPLVKNGKKGIGEPHAYIFNVSSQFSKLGYLKLVFSSKKKMLESWDEYMTRDFQRLFNLAKFNKPNHNDLPFLSNKFLREYTK